MNTFTDYVYERVRQGIQAIPPGAVDDIYAVSFYFWAEDDQPRQMTLTVSYNTNSQVGDSIDDASGEVEARWNYAFWLQEGAEICVIGEDRKDADARRRWLESIGLWYTDEEAESDADRCFELDEQIMDALVGVCATVAQRLHAAGVITTKFGRPTPIIVHELEYYEGLADLAQEVNPPGTADAFADWVRSL